MAKLAFVKDTRQDDYNILREIEEDVLDYVDQCICLELLSMEFAANDLSARMVLAIERFPICFDSSFIQFGDIELLGPAEIIRQQPLLRSFITPRTIEMAVRAFRAFHEGLGQELTDSSEDWVVGDMVGTVAQIVKRVPPLN